MVISKFPPIEDATEDGLLALGGDLDVDSLLLAYTNGIFPWPLSDEYPLAWFAPDPRGILMVDNLHISKSMQRFLNKELYKVTFNQQFNNVIHSCADIKYRKKENATWITDDIIQAYKKLFHAGHAFSVEVLQGDQLVGGLYGVTIGFYAAGESMFHQSDNASKFALIKLIEKMKELGLTWLDTQVVTPITLALGAEEIKRSDYLELLQKSIGHTSSPLASYGPRRN